MNERTTETGLQQKPAPIAVRLVAISLLDDAHAAAREFRSSKNSDAESLHDFRVAVRRLRSWLQIWKLLLADSVSRKQRHRIREIAHATGPARDVDVHIEWLKRERRRATARQRGGMREMIDRLDAQRSDTRAQALEAAAQLEELHDRLTRELSDYCVRVRKSAAAQDERFSVALVAQVRAASDVLRKRLAAVRSAAADDATHSARIAAKRLRYLLEPSARSVRGTATIVAELKKLQDVAGDAHDVHVFMDELKSSVAKPAGAGPRHLARRLRERGTRAHETLETNWLADASAPLFARLRRLADRLERARAV